MVAPFDTRVLMIFYPSSVPLDNKYCLIVNTVLFANLSQMIVFLLSAFQQCIADIFCWEKAVLAHHRFEFLAFFFIAAVINPVRVKEKNVSRIHQRDLGDIGGV